jgi:hypothetical protein
MLSGEGQSLDGAGVTTDILHDFYSAFSIVANQGRWFVKQGQIRPGCAE